MQIITQTVGFKGSEHLESFIKEKLSKVDHQAHNIIRADVTLIKQTEGIADNNCCEIRLEVPGYDHFVKKNSENFEQAITMAVDTLLEVIRRAKDKEISQRHAG